MKHFLLSGLGVLLLAGCSTTSMKGTPFYTGEYEVREGPAADRVNLWPILYYRDPALSVLWPIMEASPEHLAMRPVYSVYGKNTEHPVHNVVWPIGRFDKAHQNYRIFPFYWGDDYLTLFPFYWHKGDPVAGVGYNALFPLWIWNNATDGYSLDFVWPLCAKKEYTDRQEWRIWPLAGASKKYGKEYRYYAWPFIHHWTKSTDEKGHAVVPFYAYKRADDRETFTSLPYCRSVSSAPLETSWDFTLPLLYRQWKGDVFSWAAPLVLSWGSHDGEVLNKQFMLGLGHSLTTPDRSKHHVIPFYYYSCDPSGRAIYTLPWWSKTYADASGWNSLFPLYYRSYSADESAFYSLPWLSKKHEDGSQWSASFPFYYNSRSDDGAILLTPFYSRKLEADGSMAWRCYAPFVYLDETKDAHFMTLLGGRWSMGDQQKWLAFPLLSGGGKDTDSGRNIWLAGLAGQQWKGEEKSHYVIPFYYAAPYAGVFASLPYAAWREGDRQTYALPLLLSGWYSEGENSGSFLAGGLAGYRNRAVDSYSYVFPFYYSAPQKNSFVSLPYATWRSGDKQTRALPFLLSGKSVEDDESETLLLGGLSHWKTEAAEVQSSHVLPFYLWARDHYFYTALYGKNKEMEYFATPLAGRYRDKSNVSGSWLFPIYRHKRPSADRYSGKYLFLGHYTKSPTQSKYGFYGLYGCDRTNTIDGNVDGSPQSGTHKDINYLLFLGSITERQDYKVNEGSGEDVLDNYYRRHSFFPFWKYQITNKVAEKDQLETSSLLGFVYDVRREKKEGEEPHEYLRKRVLWRLYHHEKINGDVSTDIFPAITVDSYKNGYYKCSLLWRLFRYERNPETGEKNLDLFFIPFQRSKSE